MIQKRKKIATNVCEKFKLNLNLEITEKVFQDIIRKVTKRLPDNLKLDLFRIKENIQN